MKTLRLIINIILLCGCFLVFNESESFTPNFIGIACFALLIAINPTGDVWMQTHNKK